MSKKANNTPIYKFRVIVDTEEDVFRDIEIAAHATFEQLHLAILRSFSFEQGEMAAFYMSNENWEKGIEIPLMEMEGKEEGKKASVNMQNCLLNEMLEKPTEKVLYVYDFLRMWIFYVELIEIGKAQASVAYPCVSLAYGDAPEQDSKETDLFGEVFSEDEFSEVYGNDEWDDEADEDAYGTNDEFFDEREFDGSFSEDGDH